MMDGLLRLLAKVVVCLPRRAVVAPLGATIAWLAGSLLRIRRRLVEDGMRRAGVLDPSASAARMYRQLGRGLVDLLRCAGDATVRDAVVREVTIEGVEALDAALLVGPVVLFASHTGNWELAAAAAARCLRDRGRGLRVVAKRMSAPGVDAFLARLRGAFGLRTIAPDGALSAALHALAAGDVVVMPIDQVPDRAAHGMWLPFLGQAACVDRSPATLAHRARATVLVVAADDDGDRPRVRVLETLAPPTDAAARGAVRQAWIRNTTERATAVLEAFVRRRPDAWLWLHRRWRHPRDGARTATGKGGLAARLVASRRTG